LSELQPAMLVAMSLLAAGLLAILLLSGHRFRTRLLPERSEPERLPDEIKPRDPL